MHARNVFMILVVLIALGALTQPRSLGQPPAGPPPAPVNDPRLDQLLTRWEKETTNCATLAAEVTCSRKNPVFNRTEKLVGFAKFMKLQNGEYLARLELKSQEDPNRYEKYICTGGYIYVFRPEEKMILTYTVPKAQAGQLPDDGALPFLFGMKSEIAKKRYNLKVARETEHYTYLEVQPIYPRDKADFVHARLAILNKDWPTLPKDTPKEIYWVEPNQVEVKWDITKLQRDVPGSVQRTEFVKPELPAGWQWKTEATTATPPPSSRQPTVIRNQDR